MKLGRIREDEPPAHLQYDDSTGYDAASYDDEKDHQGDDSVLFSPIEGQSLLARHSSMPISRAVRQGNNASAPWNRAVEMPQQSAASPILPRKNEHDGRTRSSSTAAAEVRLASMAKSG